MDRQRRTAHSVSYTHLDVYKRQAKGLVKESVRGDDIFIVVDPGNYSVTYKLFNLSLIHISHARACCSHRTPQ